MAILKAKVTIVGERSILFNRFSIDTISLEKKERTGAPGNDPEEWKRSVLKTKDNQLYVDSTYIFGCLRDGAKNIKSGRGTLQAKVASTLIVSDEIILLNRFIPKNNQLTEDKTEPVYLDVRSVKNPSTKGRNIRYRVAASPGWKATFQIEWEATILDRNQMKAITMSAGSFVGLGDGRGIGFGRFIVEQFEVEEAKIEVKKSETKKPIGKKISTKNEKTTVGKKNVKA